MNFFNLNLPGFKNLAGFILATTLSFNLYAADTITLTAEQIGHLGIQLGTLKSAASIPTLTAPAKVIVPPAHEQVISAPQAGLLTHLHFAVGDTVQKGQLVAQMNSPELLTLQQQFLTLENQRQLAFVNEQRDKKLFAEGVIAQKRWQESRSQFNNLESETHSLQQLLKIAGMSDGQVRQLAQTRQFNSQINLYAPLSGVVLEKMATTGERLNSLAPVYKVANVEELWLDIAVAQEQIERVKIGELVAIANTPLTARIALLGKSVNAANQAITVRAVLNNRHAPVRVGQVVTIQLIQLNQQVAFTVPSTALAQNAGQSYLFIRDKQGFKVQAVTVIGKQGADVMISGALNGTEQIALKGAVALKANWLGLGEAE
jgi:cobalt-zinc-cadmium efflux system membrane fusion protein